MIDGIRECLKNIEDINSLPEDFPFSIEEVKATILSYPCWFEKYENQITDSEFDTFHNKHEDVTNVKNISIYDQDKDSDVTAYYVVFLDQDNDLRFVTIWWDEIVGMIKYYDKHEDIKNDLIEEINLAYEEIRNSDF